MITFILLLAGKGERLFRDLPKQFYRIKDKELFQYPLETALSIKEIDNIILVAQEEHFDHIISLISANYKTDKIRIVSGGKTRQESVYNALLASKNLNTTHVLIHDAARPLVPSSLINTLINELKNNDAVVPIMPMFDSIIEKKEDSSINSYLNRSKIFKVQTPQAFKFDIIHTAHKAANILGENNYGDDASLLVNSSTNIKTIRGSRYNFKITDETDLELLLKIINQ